MGRRKTPESETPAFSSTLLPPGSQADRCSSLSPNSSRSHVPGFPASSVQLRWTLARRGQGWGPPPELVLCRASEALEVVAGRGGLGEWVESGAGDRGWRRSKMGSWPGRRAGSGVRTTRRAGTGGSAVESTGLGETAEIGGGGRKGRSRRETHSRRHIHWESESGQR